MRKAEPLVLTGSSVSLVMIPMPPFEINHLTSLKEFEGRELPPTEWLVLTHDRIQKFSDAIEDRQWIHVDPQRAARESPYGGAVAHGFLTLSLLSYFLGQAIRVREGVGIRVNYGLNRVRFPSAVRAGSAIRARVTLLSVKESAAFVDAIFAVTIESQGVDKPSCVAEWLLRYYRA
jgi:acyl dehydratase